MHTSRCLPAGAWVPSVVLPLPGEQTECPVNVTTSIGAVSRRHALWISFRTIGNAPFAFVEFRYPGKPSVWCTMGGLPFVRVLCSLDCDDVQVTPLGDAVVWREEMRDFDPEGCR